MQFVFLKTKSKEIQSKYNLTFLHELCLIEHGTDPLSIPFLKFLHMHGVELVRIAPGNQRNFRFCFFSIYPFYTYYDPISRLLLFLVNYEMFVNPVVRFSHFL
jgi:hypothetical protein